MAQDMDATRVCRLSWLLSREREGVSEDTEVLSAPKVKKLTFPTWTYNKSS